MNEGKEIRLFAEIKHRKHEIFMELLTAETPQSFICIPSPLSLGPKNFASQVFFAGQLKQTKKKIDLMTKNRQARRQGSVAKVKV